MKRLMHYFAGSLLAVVLVLTMIPATVKAEGKTYTVAFRSGNAGKFDTSVVSSMIPGAKVSKNYIKLEIERGKTLKDTYPAIFGSDASLNSFFGNQAVLKTENAKGGYYKVNDLTDAETAEAKHIDTLQVDDQIDRNEDVVLTYSRIVKPAKYVVEYVNGESGADLAAPVYGIGENGDKITRTPIDIQGYHIKSDSVSATLKSGSTAEIIFKYSMDEHTVYETEVVYTQGDTVVNNVVNRITRVAGTATTNANAGNNANAANNGNTAGNTVVVPDDNTPLSNDNNTEVSKDKSKTSKDTEKIKDEKTPLANKGIMGNTALFATIVIIAILLVAGMSTVVVMRKKGKNDK
jgi:hypothetical protein